MHPFGKLLSQLRDLQGKTTAEIEAVLGPPTKKEAIPGQEGWALWQWVTHEELNGVISAAIYQDVCYKVIATGSAKTKDE